MSKTVDLGPVSAYALAVKYGYTGTEAEWVAEMEEKRLEAVTAALNAQSAATAASQSQTASANSATASDNSATASANSATAASGSATLAESYTHGGTGTREGEDTDNARYYMEQAKAVSAVDVATTDRAGIVKPDGTTITADEDGTLHGQSKVDEMTGATADKDGTSGTVPAPKAGQESHVLKGNGAWEALAYDSELSAESENAPKTKVVEARAREIETNIAQLSNPNLLINPDFKINQRGQTSWSGKDQYTVDRWRQFIDINGTITKDDDGLIFDNTNGKISLGHFFENPSDFAGKTVTLSAKIMKLSEDARGSIYIGGNNSVLVDRIFNSLIKDEWVTLYIVYTMPSELTNMNVCIFVNDDAQTKIKVNWMKLELGSVATPFVPPDPASELLKCQRYGELGVQLKAAIRTDNYGMIDGVNFKVTKRTTPTVTLHNNYTNMDGYIHCGGDNKNYKAHAEFINKNCFSVYFDETGYSANSQMVVQYFADAEIY